MGRRLVRHNGLAEIRKTSVINRLRELTPMPKIELLIPCRLVRELLSPALVEAGFDVFHAPTLGDAETVVLVDFDDGIDLESVSAHQTRSVKIVAMASKADSLEIGPDEVARLSGILTYDLSVPAFVQSLLLICAGERVFPHHLAMGRKLVARSEDGSEPFHLSPREREMLTHLVAGHSNKAIARRLDIAEATVKVHLKSVLRKIRVENRTQAAIWALANLPEPQRQAGHL
jgi:two-component system, NarL family, nitrate/nitrite response regulator NarL